FQAQPLKLSGETAALLSLRNVEQAVPLAVKGTLGDTQVAVDGEIRGLVTFEGVNLRYDVRGASLALVGPYFGVPLPETPKFSAAGMLTREGNTWHTTDLEGRMGKSDVAGTVTVVTGGERPRLEADLVSKLLDLADLGPLIGASNRSRYKPTSKDVKMLLPARQLEFGALGKLDAHVQVRAKQVVRVADWPFDNFRADFRLENREIVLDPIEFGMASGKLAGRVTLDARQQPANAVLAARMSGVRVAEIAPDKAAVGEAAGTLSGRIELKGRGNSVSAVLGGADGRLTLLLAEGNVPGLLPALIDLDGARVLANLVGRNPESVRCSAIDITIAEGIATPNVAVVETDTTVLSLSGRLDLETEQIDMKLTQAPKKPSFLSLRTPIVVGGTLANPDLGPAPAPLAARGAAALLLGLINPLAAVFALVETGPGEDGTCPVIQSGFQKRSASGAPS
ncbi:MAG: AsmA family protein, partial [Burkholderiales bacterium]